MSSVSLCAVCYKSSSSSLIGIKQAHGSCTLSQLIRSTYEKK